jgi:preprotein translocase subunit SecY
LIVLFTFFYTIIVFNPERIADTVQKRWGFIPWIRPGTETANHINKILMHLCLWGGMWLGLIGIYTYLLNYIPLIQSLTKEFGSLPVVVTGSWVIIIVWVVQDIINKIKSDLLMNKYDRM